MGRLFATKGCKYYIGTVKTFAGTDLTESDFAGESWTEIGGTTNVGTFGDAGQLITSEQVGASRTRKAKGTRNAGSTQIVCDLDYSDPGQLALVAAEKSDSSYAFKVQFNDAPSGGTPSLRYFVAYVMSASEELNEANNAMKLNASIEIDSNIVRVSAAA